MWVPEIFLIITDFGNQGANYIRSEADSRIDQIIAQSLSYNLGVFFGSLSKKGGIKIAKSGEMNLQTQNLLDNITASKL